MTIIEVKSKDGSESRKFVSVDKLITALTNHQIPFHPVIENVDFSGKQFEENEEDRIASDNRVIRGLDAILAIPDIRALPPEEVFKKYKEMTQTPPSRVVEATFKNCNFDKAQIFCEMNITAENCSFQKTYIECKPFTLKGKNNNFEGMDLNEGNLTLDVENCSFKDAQLYKSHISGKLKNCNFEVTWTRTWLGQHNNLIMDNIDFGTEEIEPDYFFSEKLTLRNPKINAKTMDDIKQINPNCLKKDIPMPSKPAKEL